MRETGRKADASIAYCPGFSAFKADEFTAEMWENVSLVAPIAKAPVTKVQRRPVREVVLRYCAQFRSLFWRRILITRSAAPSRDRHASRDARGSNRRRG
jgi:hypothetical protein